jgi:integrase
MTDVIVVPQAAHWQRLKRLVLDSVSSPITRRVYNLGLDEFFEWYGREPRPGFTKVRRSCAKMCRAADGELEQIQLLLGHASVQTTERYLGTKQDLVHAPNDGIELRVMV